MQAAALPQQAFVQVRFAQGDRLDQADEDRVGEAVEAVSDPADQANGCIVQYRGLAVIQDPIVAFEALGALGTVEAADDVGMAGASRLTPK